MPKVYFNYRILVFWVDFEIGMQHVRETVEKAQPDIMVCIFRPIFLLSQFFATLSLVYFRHLLSVIQRDYTTDGLGS